MVIDIVKHTHLIRAACYHATGAGAALTGSRGEAAGGAERRIKDSCHTTEGDSIIAQLPHLYSRVI
jgi:hypothetical protein